jgi:type I restriction enzyme S subunit
LREVAVRSVPPDTLRLKRINEGDIVVEKSGGGPQQPAGRVAYCDFDFGGTCSNFVEIVRVHERYDSKFVFYLLHYLYKSGLVLKYQQQTTGIINFKLREYQTEIVRIPVSKSEQAAIAEILATVDQAIAQTEALIAKQRRIKAGLLHDLLTRGIDEQGNLRDPATHRFKESPVGLVPEEWEVLRVSAVCNVASGGTPARTNSSFWNGTIPWIKTAEVDYRVINEAEEHITELGLANSSAKVFPRGTLVMAIYGEGITRGKVAILGIDAATNQACLAFFPESILKTEFLYYYFMVTYSRLRDLSHDGSQKNLSAALIGNTFVPIPALTEQGAICEAIHSLEAFEKGEVSSLLKFHRLKTGLMQDLLTGRVSVAGVAKGVSFTAKKEQRVDDRTTAGGNP